MMGLLLLLALAILASIICFFVAKTNKENALSGICLISTILAAFFAGALGYRVGVRGGQGIALPMEDLQKDALYLAKPATNVLWISPAFIDQLTGEVLQTNDYRLYANIIAPTNDGPVITVQKKKGIVLKTFPLKAPSDNE